MFEIHPTEHELPAKFSCSTDAIQLKLGFKLLLLAAWIK